MDALVTLSSKSRLVIPARLRQFLGLKPGDRLDLRRQADGLRPLRAPGRAMTLPIAFDTNLLVRQALAWQE